MRQRDETGGTGGMCAAHEIDARRLAPLPTGDGQSAGLAGFVPLPLLERYESRDFNVTSRSSASPAVQCSEERQKRRVGQIDAPSCV